MNILFNRPSTPEAAAIRERVFNVLPAASYQMEKLFGLFDMSSAMRWKRARNAARLPGCCSTRVPNEYCKDNFTPFVIPHEPTTQSSGTPGSSRVYPTTTPLRRGDHLMLCHGATEPALHPDQRLRFRARAPAASAAAGWTSSSCAHPTLRRSNASSASSTVRTNRARSPTTTSTSFCARNWPGVTFRMHFCSDPTDHSKMRMVC